MKNIKQKRNKQTKGKEQLENAIKQAVVKAIGKSITELAAEECKDNAEYKEEIKQSYIASAKQAIKCGLLTREDLAEVIFSGKPAAIVAELDEDYGALISLAYLSKAHMVSLLTMTIKTTAKAMETDEKKLLRDIEAFMEKAVVGEPSNDNRTTTTTTH